MEGIKMDIKIRRRKRRKMKKIKDLININTSTIF